MKTYTLNEFKIGEVVYLKSDLTQPMVIANMDIDENLIQCTWRIKGVIKSINEGFKPEMLCKESDKPPKRTLNIIAIGD